MGQDTTVVYMGQAWKKAWKCSKSRIDTTCTPHAHTLHLHASHPAHASHANESQLCDSQPLVRPLSRYNVKVESLSIVTTVAATTAAMNPTCIHTIAPASALPCTDGGEHRDILIVYVRARTTSSTQKEPLRSLVVHGRRGRSNKRRGRAAALLPF